MENLKLVSLRLDPRTIEKVEKAAASLTYWKKTDVMRKGIELVAYLAEHHLLDKVMKFCPEFGDVVDKFEFQFHREFKR